MTAARLPRPAISTAAVAVLAGLVVTRPEAEWSPGTAASLAMLSIAYVAHGYFSRSWASLLAATGCALFTIGCRWTYEAITGTLPGPEADPGSHPTVFLLGIPVVVLLTAAGVTAAKLFRALPVARR